MLPTEGCAVFKPDSIIHLYFELLKNFQHLHLVNTFLRSGTYPKGNVSKENVDKKKRKLNKGDLTTSYS